MNKITVKCPAKINLFLNIVGTKDNMHLLNMINNTVDLYDVLEVEMLEDNLGNIKLECDNPVIPIDEKNSVYKSLKLMMDEFSINNSFNVFIKKRIPLEAGMGGESTDAAGVMVAVNKLCNLNLSIDDLCKLGIRIGSDVPYCIYGGAACVKSLGDVISRTSIAYKYYVVIKPDFSMNTKEAFKKYDEAVSEYRVLKEKIGHNDFEIIIPEIVSIKNDLMIEGAVCSNMTGSGTAVVGCFDNRETQESAYSKLSSKYKVYKVCSCNGIEII